MQAIFNDDQLQRNRSPEPDGCLGLLLLADSAAGSAKNETPNLLDKTMGDFPKESRYKTRCSGFSSTMLTNLLPERIGTMFFKLSAPHVSLREYMYEGNLVTKPLVLLIACVVKLFRIPIPSSTDIPPVQSLDEFRVPAENVAPEILVALTDMDRQLRELGFTRIDWIGIKDTQNNTEHGGAVYRSADGNTVAWTRYRLWPNLERHNKFTRLALYSLGPQGEIILTTAASRDLLDPPDWDVRYHPKVNINRLQEFHQEHVQQSLGNARPMIAKDDQSAFDLLEHTHEEFVAFQVERGVFVTLPNITTPASASPAIRDEEIETAQLETSSTARGLIDRSPPTEPDQPTIEVESIPVTDEMQPIIDAVRKQETKQSGWLTKIVILGISIAFFIGLGALQWEMELVLILVPILLVHELGHYVAMKAFGYKNIHMFFIPLLGAAVSGRNYRVSGWKKSIVALAGPVPSIALGILLGGIGIWTENDWCLKGAIITLILNIMNLAPFLPLDGGQVAHITLFSRSNIVDLLFRIGTIAVLIGIGALLQAKFLLGLGVVMVLGLPTIWRTMKATDLVRNQNLPEPTGDTMPVETIHTVVAAIEHAKIPTQGIPALAKLTLSVYENVIIRPPNWPVTVSIWAVYFGALVTGVVGMIAITFASLDDGLFGFDGEFETNYQRVDLDDNEFRLGQPDAESDAPKTDLLCWRFDDAASATAAFEKLRDNSDDSVARFGNFVFTGHASSEPDLERLDDNSEAIMRAMEQFSNDDPRLDFIEKSEWRRTFTEPNPGLAIVVSAKHAKTITRVCENLPLNIGDHSPIAPWTPNTTLSAEQIELQEKLRVLQGVTAETPWETVDQHWDNEISPESSPEQFREMMQQSAKDSEQTHRNRAEWIQQQSESTSGVTQQLYDAYAQYDAAAKAWREDDRPTVEKGNHPRIADSLAPLLNELGYLDTTHPQYATSVRIDAFDDLDTESVTEDFPLPINGKTIVHLTLYPTRDVAAAYACVHDWLNKREIHSVAWVYETLAE